MHSEAAAQVINCRQAARDPFRPLRSNQFGYIEMPYYCVVMNGEGISVPSAGDDIVGFYTTRWVKAEGSEGAEEIAKQLVLLDWTEGEYADVNKGDPPIMTVDSVSPVSFLKYLWRQPGKGHAFYSSE